MIFTNADLNETRTVILAEKVAAPARAGAVAPADVFVPAGNTGMEPGKTSFFQALGVPTKIARGTIEITTDLKLVEAGGKVGASEATLLNMLNISPFTYGMGISQIYDQGQTFPVSVLDIEEKQLMAAFMSAIKTITTVSLALNYPTLPSIMHTLVNGYKKVLAVAIETEYSWPEIDELKDRIANPDSYAAAAPTSAAAEAAEEKAEDKPAEEKEEEKEESEDEGKPSTLLSLLTMSDLRRFWWSVRLVAYWRSDVDTTDNVEMNTICNEIASAIVSVIVFEKRRVGYSGPIPSYSYNIIHFDQYSGRLTGYVLLLPSVPIACPQASRHEIIPF